MPVADREGTMQQGEPRASAALPSHGADAHERVRILFDALRDEAADAVSRGALRDALARSGLQGDDPRLASAFAALEAEDASQLDYAAFHRAVQPAALLIEKALQGRLVIPRFDEFAAELESIFGRVEENRGGAVADYIPQLARVEADQFGAAVCTVDGQRLALGHADVAFCVQSCCKPINYCLALEEHGARHVHEMVGCEPSGVSFNELSLNGHGRPHNPMINAGAIVSSSMIRQDESAADRFDYVMDCYQRLAGGRKPGFSNPTYLSERRTADRNFALGHMIRENGGFPEEADLVETLEFYFQCCSIEMTAESMSILAATLANGGVCPTTGERVLQPDTVQMCLSLMSTCGMYDYSGAWAFAVGLPAKSGVAGGVFVVVPNVLGLCVWSPRLDEHGNSVRGVEYCRELVRNYNFHQFDNLVGALGQKRDPRLSQRAAQSAGVVDLCWAACEGDLQGLRSLLASGASLDAADYDGRTPLHLAASEGHVHVVEFFIRRSAVLDPRDRWGATPMDDATRGGHEEVATVLRHALQARGRSDAA